MKCDVFICCSRESEEEIVQSIYNELVSKSYTVFRDSLPLHNGYFNEGVLRLIDESQDVILLVSQDVLESNTEIYDLIVHEISYAIKQHKNIIPILLEGFSWPENMPVGLEKLAEYKNKAMRWISGTTMEFLVSMDLIQSRLVSQPNSAQESVLKEEKEQEARAEDSKKFSWGQRVKLLIPMLLILLSLTGVGVLGKQYYQRYEAQYDKMLSIVLIPPEDMNVTEYYEAAELVKKRIAILAGDKKHRVKVTKENIDIRLPLEVFSDLDAKVALKSYITRPIKLYLKDTETGNKIPLEREEIEKIDVENGSVEAIDVSQYGFKDGEGYEYIKLTLTDEAQKKLEKVWGTDGQKLVLAQDAEDYSAEYYYYMLYKGKKKNEYYFVDKYQLSNIGELIKFNYTNDTFSEGFRISLLYPVEWEKVEDITTKGKNQCNVETLYGNQVVVQYEHNSTTPVTEGEFYDTVDAMKARLDALEIPYAFGYTMGGEKKISVKIDADKVGLEIMEMVGQYNLSLEIYNPFINLNTYLKSAECVQNDNGVYELVFTGSEYETNKLREIKNTIQDSKNQNIYLYYRGYNFKTICANGEVSQVLEKLDEGKLIFDNLIGFGYDEITQENVNLANFITTFFSEKKINKNYQIAQYRIMGEKDACFGIEEEYLSNKADEIYESIKDICPNAEIEWDGSSLEIELNLEIDDEIPEKLIKTIKKLYNHSVLGTGEAIIGINCVSEENEYLRIVMSPSGVEEKIQYSGTYYGIKITKLVPEIISRFADDTFFSNELVPIFEIENWLEDWNFLLNR